MKFINTTIILLFSLSIGFAQNSNIELLGQLAYNTSLSDIWGYEDEGKEYALIGLNNAFSIVDVSDAENPVEVDRINGPNSTWRDIKTWDHYAYITNETSQGCLIVDLQYLPDSTVTYNFVGDSGETFTTAHNVFIDELGIMYIIGGNNSNGGCLMYDLNEDPTKPKFAGKYNASYVHDAYARDNILYTSEGGEQAIVDISDKANPVILGKVSTYGYTHNCWISDDANTLYTTDETSGTWVVSWDISDPTDIKQLDRWQSSPGEGVIPHNTFVRGDFVITSYYTDGVTITNVSDPASMVQVGNYDTSPSSGGGFNGCWGVYPYLPSGNIIASDIQEGLFVLKPEYKQAAYLNGLVVDAETGTPVIGASLNINNQTIISDLNGVFKYGSADGETFTVTANKFGYDESTADVRIIPGGTTEVTIELTKKAIVYNITGNLFDADDNAKLSEGTVVFTSGDTQLEYIAENGAFTIDSLYVGDYNVVAGTWGYLPVEMKLSATQTDQELNLYLNKGIYDDFALDYGWTMENRTASGNGGDWQLANPVFFDYYGFAFGIENDIATDIGEKCYVTGNEEAFDFVAGGTSSLYSPEFDMSAMENPYISFHSFIQNFSYYGPSNDVVEFKLSNGTDEIIIHTDSNQNVEPNKWNFHNYSIKDQIELTQTMQFSVNAIGASQQNILESGLDVFQVVDSATTMVAANSIIIDDEMEAITMASTGNTFNIAENDIVVCENPQYYLASYNNQVFSNVNIENGILSFDVADASTYGNYQIAYGVNCGGADNNLANVSVAIGELINVDEAVQNKLQISPNPAKDIIYVSGLTQPGNQINYKLYSISGQLMDVNYLNNFSKINLKNIEAGVYIIKFYASDKIHSINKIIKE